MGKRVYAEVAQPDKDYARASNRRSKERHSEEGQDAYDAFEMFKRRARKKGKK